MSVLFRDGDIIWHEGKLVLLDNLFKPQHLLVQAWLTGHEIESRRDGSTTLGSRFSFPCSVGSRRVASHEIKSIKKRIRVAMAMVELEGLELRETPRYNPGKWSPYGPKDISK